MRRRIVLGLGLIAAAYLALAMANPMGTMVHGDGYYTYLWARTIVFDGDLDFHEDYRVCPDPWGLARTPIGEDQNYWNMGPALFWIPILAVDRISHPAARSDNPRVALACEEPMTDRAVSGSLVAGLLAVLIGLVLARRYFSDGVALFGVAGIALFTSLAYYATIMWSYGHAASSFACGLAILAWDSHRRRPSALGWVLQGLAIGLAMLMRAQNGILVVLPFATWLFHAYGMLRARDGRAIGKHVAIGFAFVACVLVVFFPQSWFWHHTTGSWLTVPQGEGYVRWGSPMLHKALFSAMGLVPWTPIHIPAILGLLVLALRRRTRVLGVGFLVLFALDGWIVGATYDWWGSVGFPGRRFDLLAIPFMVGLAAFGHEIWRWARRKPGVSLVLSAMLLFVPLGFCTVAVQMGVARGMRTDVAQGSPSLWRSSLDQIVDPIWEAVGNPLTWPASIPFAVHYGTHPRRWDLVGGPEIFYHDERTLRYRTFESTIVIGERDQHLYVDGPAADEEVVTERGERGIRLRPGTARLFLPIHFTEAGRLELQLVALDESVAPRVAVTINGSRLGTRRLSPGGRAQRVSYDLPLGSLKHGINEAWIWVDDAPVLLVRAQIFDPTPSPEDRQRDINRQIFEERRRAIAGE